MTMTPFFKGFLIGLLIITIVVGPILVFARELPAQAEEACAVEGGCVWVSQKWLGEQLAFARLEGQREIQCRNFTSEKP